MFSNGTPVAIRVENVAVPRTDNLLHVLGP
jgi:hypothetical protein